MQNQNTNPIRKKALKQLFPAALWDESGTK